MKLAQLITENYFKTPNDLFYAVDTPHEYTVLLALLYYANGWNNGIVNASFKSLGFGLVSRRQCIRIIQKFQELGFLEIQKHLPFQPNKIMLNLDNINYYALKRMDTKTLGRKALKQYTKEQQDAMTIRRAVQNPQLAHRAEELLGNQIIQRGTENGT